MLKRFYLIFIIIFISRTAFSQNNIRIYAGILSNKTYIVGAKNPSTGIIVSADNGNTWRRIFWNNIRVFSLDVQQKSNGMVIYAGCGNGILKTINGGKKWIITTDWKITEVQEICIDTDNKNIIYAGTAYGMVKSEDGGNEWLEINQGLKQTFISALTIRNGIVYCGTEKGIYFSKNRRKLWVELGLQNIPVRVIKLDKNNHIYAGTEDRGIFKSTDSGKNWLNILKNETVYDIAINPENCRNIFAGTFGKGVYFTRDGGKNWMKPSGEMSTITVHSLCIDPENPETIFAGTINHGIFKSETVPVVVPQRKGEPIIFDTDERPMDTSLEKMAKLPPVFKKDGTVTAGNSSGINDAAAAVSS